MRGRNNEEPSKKNQKALFTAACGNAGCRTAGTLPAVYAAEDSPETMIMTETDTVGSDHGQESGTPDSGNREEETSGETDMARMWQVS